MGKHSASVFVPQYNSPLTQILSEMTVLPLIMYLTLTAHFLHLNYVFSFAVCADTDTLAGCIAQMWDFINDSLKLDIISAEICWHTVWYKYKVFDACVSLDTKCLPVSCIATHVCFVIHTFV